ncbi:hypothetical protein VKT23_014182 [Stygiomarasmius scandens]|uniref:Uncharacterized protein n=1 Tax=Marasmiellus scandens TaxID=2682957 RepID=A0ABR1J0N3_9AGAR
MLSINLPSIASTNIASFARIRNLKWLEPRSLTMPDSFCYNGVLNIVSHIGLPLIGGAFTSLALFIAFIASRLGPDDSAILSLCLYLISGVYFAFAVVLCVTKSFLVNFFVSEIFNDYAGRITGKERLLEFLGPPSPPSSSPRVLDLRKTDHVRIAHYCILQPEPPQAGQSTWIH